MVLLKFLCYLAVALQLHNSVFGGTLNLALSIYRVAAMLLELVAHLSIRPFHPFAKTSQSFGA